MAAVIIPVGKYEGRAPLNGSTWITTGFVPSGTESESPQRLMAKGKYRRAATGGYQWPPPKKQTSKQISKQRYAIENCERFAYMFTCIFIFILIWLQALYASGSRAYGHVIR